MAQNGQLKCPKYREKTGINQFDLKMGLLKLGDPCDSRALRQIETALGKDSLGARTEGGQDQGEGKSQAGGAPKRTPDGTEVIELHMKNQVEDDLEHPTIDQYPTAMLDTNSRKSHSSHPCDSDAEQLFRDLNLDPQVRRLVQEESRNSQRKLSGERGYSTNRPQMKPQFTNPSQNCASSKPSSTYQKPAAVTSAGLKQPPAASSRLKIFQKRGSNHN